MKFSLFCALFMALACLPEATKYFRNPPKVQVYSHEPGAYDESNVLICAVSEFHPPDISIHLMKDGELLHSARQTDLAFNGNWHFHLTNSATFTPRRGEKFLCRVDHGGRITQYEWEPNM